MNATVTIAFSNHRPETVAISEDLMGRHDAVFLEEPPDPEFIPMLRGDVSIDDYLLLSDTEYPGFSRRMCHLLRRLHSGGTAIVQVEPFIEVLLGIHERFAAGGRPSDLLPQTVEFSVYQAERKATAALIEFYQVSRDGDFDDLLPALQRFAECDARRFLLRDRMRSEALAARVIHYPHSYVEAGQIHAVLPGMLRTRLPRRTAVKSRFLMDPIARSFGGAGHLYGPGDVLTLLLMFDPNRRHPIADLLSARALVFNKLIEKEEILDSDHPFPHTRDEVRTDWIVRRLSLTDCRALFPKLRRQKTAGARKMVSDYLRQKK